MEILLILVCVIIYISIDSKEDRDAAEPSYDYAEAKR